MRKQFFRDLKEDLTHPVTLAMLIPAALVGGLVGLTLYVSRDKPIETEQRKPTCIEYFDNERLRLPEGKSLEQLFSEAKEFGIVSRYLPYTDCYKVGE